ncbi:phage major capsid protein [Mycobacterium sp. UM_CSW]|uniref:phage major capsid protein n=1 Tax=Mycobacterium sp. UM_CSW TaxID=1370119 RepID=UPI000401B08B|nr:phage major capsid protein [Mycobacterium sp. UM_CSW]
MPSKLKLELDRLTQARNEARARRQAIVDRAEREDRKDLTEAETRAFNTLTEDISVLDERVGEAAAELRRSGYGDPTVDAVRGGTAAAPGAGGPGGPDARSASEAWGRNTAAALRRDLGGGEQRAVISGSVDVPTLVLPSVVDIPHPARLIDLFTNRQVSESMAFEYFRQTARVNNATAVPDLATKPTSVLTVQAIQDRCRVIAHLSEPVPYRIFVDQNEISSWLADEMAQGVLDAIEAEAIGAPTGTGPGTGSGEHMVGVRKVAGTTAVAFNTDVPTTLRHAVTVMQNLGEQPTGWALNPADAEAIDLLRWGASGGFLTGGYEGTGQAEQANLADNIFGPTRPRVVSPSVPQGTAILADWTKLKLFVHWGMTIMVNAFSDSLFQANAVQLRAEMLVGIGILRPQSFALVALA